MKSLDMAIRLIYVLLISLLLYVHVSGDYCQNENKPSIQFCQNGTISGSEVYINGSSVKTKYDLTERGCVCHLEQIGNKEILVDAKESCLYCGLKVTLGNAGLRSSYYGSSTHGWGWIVLNDTKFTMTLAWDEGTGNLNTAFCITIQENRPDIPVVLTLTCEDIATRSSTASSTSPTVIPTSSNNVLDTTKGQSPTSAETDTSLPKTVTTKTTEVSTGNTNVTQVSKATDTTTGMTIATTANNPGEPHTQNEVIIPAAAGGGAGVLVILVILIVVCCLRKKRQDAENPVYMKELEKSDAIMTDNAAYGISIDTNTNSVSHIQAYYTGDVYAVVNKEGTSNVFPSAKVPRMQVGETGDVYALVNKENVGEIPNIEHSLEKSTKSLLQTRSNKNNVTVDITPSTDYADITI